MKRRNLFSIVQAAIVVVSCCPAVMGQSSTSPSETVWDGPVGRPGSWFLTYNWNAGVPNPQLDARIERDTAVIHDFGGAMPVLAGAANLTISGPESGELEILSGRLRIADTLTLGHTQPSGLTLGDIINNDGAPGYGQLLLLDGELSAKTIHINSPKGYASLNPSPDWHNVLTQLGGKITLSDTLNVGYGGSLTLPPLIPVNGIPLSSTDDIPLSSELFQGLQLVDVSPDRWARYILRNGRLTVPAMAVGTHGDGQMVQSGGQVCVQDKLDIRGLSMSTRSGTNIDADGNITVNGGDYRLEDGLLESTCTAVGAVGTGYFIQSGGAHRCDVLEIASPNHVPLTDYFAVSPRRLAWPYTEGVYRLSDGQCACDELFVGHDREGRFEMTGGRMRVAGIAQFGGSAPQLQSNGLIDRILIRWGAYAHGVLNGGHFTADAIIVAGNPESDISQDGADVLCNQLKIVGHASSYALSGGRLRVGELVLGNEEIPAGLPTVPIIPNSALSNIAPLPLPTNERVNTLRIAAARGLTVTDRLDFGFHAALEAEDYFAIAMNGADLLIRDSDPAALAALGKCHLRFTPGETDFKSFQTLEAASEDRGLTRAGFRDNFVIESIALNAACRLNLADDFANQPQSESPEAVYVRRLFVGEGSVLDLAGLKIYYLKADIRGKIIDSSSVIDVAPARGAADMALLEGDVNLDGVVDIQDFAAIKANYGISEGAHWSRGDLDGDGTVGANDFAILKRNYGRSE